MVIMIVPNTPQIGTILMTCISANNDDYDNDDDDDDDDAGEDDNDDNDNNNSFSCLYNKLCTVHISMMG